MAALTELAGVTVMATSIRTAARSAGGTLQRADATPEESESALGEFAGMRQQVTELTTILAAYVDTRLRELQESTQRAQQISAWQVAALVPGTLVLVLIFTILVARPIRQIDNAIHQLGESGFSKPIEVRGPTDLERLGRQLEWLRVRIDELPDGERRLLAERFEQDRTLAETGAALGLSLNAVHGRIRRIVERLRQGAQEAFGD